MRYPNFISGSYESQAVTADQERTVNFYVEKMESRGATTDAALYPTPGVEELLTHESVSVSNLLTDLVSHWKLDETSGPRADSHGANALTDNNTVTSNTGKLGVAGQFVAANSEYLSLPDNADVSMGDFDWTIAAWVYLDSKPAALMSIVTKVGGVNGQREYALRWINNTDRFTFRVYSSADVPVSAIADTLGAPALGTWYHVVGWHDAAADTVNISVNGGAVDSVATSGLVPNDSVTEFRIGASTLGHYHDGRIDEVSIWKRKLTTQERTDLYNGGAGLEHPFLAGPEISISGPGRGHFFMDGREFAVIGTGFYEIDQFGHRTSRGTVAIGSTPATISSNGDGGGQLFVTSGTNGYVYNLAANTLTAISALNGKATMGAYLDGYFLALDSSTSTLYLSDLLDGATWTTGTDFAQRSIAPDPWVSGAVAGKFIWLLGEQTSEVWYNEGRGNFPLAAHPSGLVPYGCAAPFSVASADGTLLWLGASKIGDAYVLRAAGLQAEVVSDFPLQRIIGGYATISDAVADIYTDQGHTFYVLSFPTQNVTWALDLKSGQWAERASWDTTAGEYIAWRPRFHAMAFGEHRMLDSSTGSIYRMSSLLGSDADGAPIRRMRRAPSLQAENERVFYSTFELDLEPGLGTATGQGTDPQVMLRMSNDGGKTWGAEQTRSAGKIGDYGQRVRFERLGAARRRVFEITMSDPIPFRLTGAYLNLAQLPAALQKKTA